MQVKIGDSIYDANEEMIMLILSKEERNQIRDMDPNSKGYYCQAPDGIPVETIKEFMKI